MFTCKPDWADAQRRLTALWHGERLDRPCISVTAPVASTIPTVPIPQNLEDYWLDPGYRVAAIRRELACTWWGGESIPSSTLMAGWMVCLGGRPRFERDTIWYENQTVDCTQPSPFRHDDGSVWMHKYRRLLAALCHEANAIGLFIGAPLMLPANDLISMHLGPEQFLLAMMDHPQWSRDAIIAGARDQLQALRALQQFLRDHGHGYWYGNAGWMHFWAPQPFISTQSDVSCMLSPDLFDRFVVPELDIFGEAFGALWYHLDGAEARQHLPRLLSLPYLRVLQYTTCPSEPENGPAHLAMYKQIQAAGKIVHIRAPRQNIEPLVRELDPGLLMLQTGCPTRDEGERLLDRCAAWCRHTPVAP